MDLDTILKLHSIARSDFESTGLEWSTIQTICADHSEKYSERHRVGKTVADTLLDFAGVHSVRVRVKSPDHLAAKMIRKRLSDARREFTLESYESEITDLIGVRALHLFKDDWKTIHKSVERAWNWHEKPKAYYRRGDRSELVESFKEAGCDAAVHPFGYRSVHYLLKSQPGRTPHIVELQVRTLFEEGWSEIDHRVRYPRHSDDQHLSTLLDIFNQLSGSADEMGTFTARLSAHVAEQRERDVSQQTLLSQKEAELAALVAEIEMQASERAKIEALQQEVGTLRRSPYQAVLSGDIGNSSQGWMFDAAKPMQMTPQLQFCRNCGSTFLEGDLYDSIQWCPACREKSYPTSYDLLK